MSKLRRRVERLDKHMQSLPPSSEGLRRAFARFRRTGDLPEDEHLAWAVVEWANTGVDPTGYSDDADGRGRLIRAYVNSRRSTEDEAMTTLRNEAVGAPEPARSVARDLLKFFAEFVEDPSEPVLKNKGIKVERTCSSVALSLTGFPRRFMPSDREAEVNDVLARLERIRDQVAQDHADDYEGWFEQLDECAQVFCEEGALPEDALLREAVLASKDFVALLEAGAAERASKLAELQAAASRRPDRPATE